MNNEKTIWGIHAGKTGDVESLLFHENVIALGWPKKGWTLKDKANHNFTFPEYIIQPGQICRVYTNEYHPEWCNFNYVFSNSAIWNNGGDCASLMDAQGKTIDEYCY